MSIPKCLAFPIVLACAAPGGAAEPFLDKVDLFRAGTDGYALYRIPGLAVTPKGSLLAYCEARKTDGRDWDAIDVLLRRSADGGKTWSPPRRVSAVEGPHRKHPLALEVKGVDPEAVTHNNPVAVADRKTGAVHLLYCYEYMRVFHRRSDDDGQTFGPPVEITAALEGLRMAYPWAVVGTGPAHGIQLKGGRLLVPVWLSTGTGGNAHRPSSLATLYSDDGGRSWRAGEIVAGEADPLRNPNETAAVELADGRVMLNVRSESDANRRAVSFSPDGATGWTRPAFDDRLLEPVCMASICRLSLAPPADRNRIVFANPDNLERAAGKAVPGGNRDRKNLSVKLSYDEGKTWAVNRVLEPGLSAYSDLAVGPDGTIFCLYERGSTDGKNNYATRTLTLARFNADWLTGK